MQGKAQIPQVGEDSRRQARSRRMRRTGSGGPQTGSGDLYLEHKEHGILLWEGTPRTGLRGCRDTLVEPLPQCPGKMLGAQ